MMRGKTSDKREARAEIFAREYLIDLNGARAAIAAGYSKKGADVAAQRMLGNVRVKALIAKLTEEKFAKLDISAERILQELARLAFLDPRRLFTPEGDLRPIAELDEDTARAIAGLDHEKLFEHFGKGQAKHVGTISKVKLADKTRALELLGKYRKLFTEKLEVTASEDLAALIAEGRKRAAQR
jgi:phage terminase small subunit